MRLWGIEGTKGSGWLGKEVRTGGTKKPTEENRLYKRDGSEGLVWMQ